MSDAPVPAPPAVAPAAPAAPWWRDAQVRQAFAQGDARSLVALATERCGADATLELARFAIELRRQSVSVIGNHEVFFRRTEGGVLAQVIAPVRLSLADDSLYQLPVWGKYKVGTNTPWREGDGKFEWCAVVPDANRNKATITAYGLQVVNRVAGCAVGQPDSVEVDGEMRTNPYVERGPNGDPRRIVVRVNIVGPAPATGNPVVVQYTLDLDPAKDLQHMLLQIVKDGVDDPMSTAAYLVDSEEWDRGVPAPRWKFLPLYGGVGVAHNLGDKEVAKAYGKYVNLLQNALKKAQTVARRNAMRAHPALAYQTVQIDNTGSAVIAVTGWASQGGSIDRYAELLERMSRGLGAPAELRAEIHRLDDVYDPAEHVTGDAEVDVQVTDAAPVADEAVERNALIAQIDGLLVTLSPARVAELGYAPETQTTDELRAILARMGEP